MGPPVVLVAGSLHYDVVVSAARLPGLDETLPGRSVRYLCGGKGANQAIAAALHGAPTAMAGQVGDDAAGTVLLEALDAAGVDRSAVASAPGTESGMSVAIATDTGDYGAVIVSAANLTIDAAAIAIPDSARILLLQNEIPEAANLLLAENARAAGVRIVLNAAPARPFETALPALVDLLIVNRVEVATMWGSEVTTEADAIEAARALASGGCDTIVTLSDEGAVLATPSGEARHHPAHPVDVASTHGAGDAFAGALAARLALGSEIGTAFRYAQCAAALHVSRPPDQRGGITAAEVWSLCGRD